VGACLADCLADSLADSTAGFFLTAKRLLLILRIAEVMSYSSISPKY
jgi:hypothetical protein